MGQNKIHTKTVTMTGGVVYRYKCVMEMESHVLGCLEHTVYDTDWSVQSAQHQMLKRQQKAVSYPFTTLFLPFLLHNIPHTVETLQSQKELSRLQTGKN